MTLSPLQEEKLRQLLRVFLAENAKLNLSAYRTEETVWMGNVLDALPAADLLRDAKTVLDLGTGGGFPLLPLALLLPEVTFTGLDATKKKIDAVQRIVNTLGMTNVRLLVGRAEELGHDASLRERFDVTLSRAVADLSTLLEYMSPFTRVGGRMICWKSLTIDEELQASVTARMQLQCRLMERYPYNLDEMTGLPAVAQSPLRGGWGRRQLLVFEKLKTLPREFPRRVGIPKKEPLGGAGF